MTDSTTIVSTGNAIITVAANAINVLWPIIASILTYVAAHNFTKKNYVRKEKQPKKPQAPAA